MTPLQTEFMGPYESWQLEKFGNVLPDPATMSDDEIFENGTKELQRMDEYLRTHDELEILNFQL